MTDSRPRTSASKSNTPVEYSRKIPVPSITMNKDDFNSLVSILEKTGQTPTFQLKTDREELTFTDIQFLANQKWPANVKELRLQRNYPGPYISGYIYTPDQLSFSNITLESDDRDWISARSDELIQFFNQHRNWHHIFHKFKYTLPQGILLVALLGYWIVTSFTQRGWDTLWILPFLAANYAVYALYGALLPKVFPYLVLEPEHPTFNTRLRSAMKYLIPAIFASLIAAAIRISFP